MWNNGRLGPSGKGATKRSAARASTPDLDLEHVRTVAQTRRLGNLTVVELKAALSNLGLQVALRFVFCYRLGFWAEERFD